MKNMETIEPILARMSPKLGYSNKTFFYCDSNYKYIVNNVSKPLYALLQNCNDAVYPKYPEFSQKL